jgi:hypothetical protein
MQARRLNVFFYGLFMDEACSAQRGFLPPIRVARCDPTSPRKRGEVTARFLTFPRRLR